MYQIFDYVYDSIKSLINTWIGSVLFFIEDYRKRYPYILVGEKTTPTSKETILLYRAAGKRHVYEISAKEICNTKHLISNFHPLDVRVISFIAGMEYALEYSVEERETKFHFLKEKVFKLFS